MQAMTHRLYSQNLKTQNTHSVLQFVQHSTIFEEE